MKIFLANNLQIP